MLNNATHKLSDWQPARGPWTLLEVANRAGRASMSGCVEHLRQAARRPLSDAVETVMLAAISASGIGLALTAAMAVMRLL